jgi:exodeoxyribonuclease VII large subunit
MTDNIQAISVSDLTSQIKNILEGEFENIWVSGEISNFKHHYSGHMYLTLKDDDAEIRAVMFKGFNQYLRFKPEDGMLVLAGGRLTVYEQRGQYQLVLKQMEPSGIGTLYLAFEALKRQLAEEGLFDLERKSELPKYPKSVGVITSKSGAAVQDIFQVLERRSPFVKILLRPTKVQGNEAAEDIADAINEFNDFKEIDVIIMGRGGGSLEDMWPFNEEIVARAISNSSIPIISAVGHETDFSISDMVADYRAPTPSAAAEIVSASSNEIVDYLYGFKKRIESGISNLLEKNWQKLDDIFIRHAKQKPQKIIDKQRGELELIFNRLLKSIIDNKKLMEMKLKPLTEKLSALNPQAILNRGYSVAFNLPGREIIKSNKDIKNEQEFELLTAKGSFTAKKLKNKK